MIAAAIVVGALILIALLRVGVAAEYSREGVSVAVKVGFVKIRILPRKEKPKKPKKPKKVKKPKKPKKPKKEPEEEKKPGGLKKFLDMWPAIKTALGRLRRRLLIKKLAIHYTAAGDDPFTTALSYGASNAVFGVITPVLEKNFRIKRRDFRTDADFEATEPLIFVHAAISIAVWEIIYIGMGFLKATIKRKEVRKYGQAPDKRVNGDNDAKNPGDG